MTRLGFKTLGISLAITAVLAAGETWAVESSGSANAIAAKSEHVPGEVLIQYRQGVSPMGRTLAQARIGAVEKETLVAGTARKDGKGDLVLATLPPGLPVAAAVRGLEDDAAVEFAEPNWIYQHQDLANDPYYTSGKLWGMYGDATYPANANGSQASEAWNAGHTGSAGVYVAVIDEGVMYSHQDLAANSWVNPYELVDGIDNDGNGFVDDVHGWDFDGNNNTTYDGTVDNHGTHVAGTIGAVGGNSTGVAGINWNVRIINAKFLGRRGGSLANAIKAIGYITDLKTRHGLNIVASNNSWGGGGFSQALLDAINRGGDAGILFIAAAGNGGSDGAGDNNDLIANYPSNYQCTTSQRSWDCVIAVAAIGGNGSLASFSNYGVTSVDLGAPGVSIYSTLPGKGNTSSYGAYNGTSMATPHVTGAVALYASTHPIATPEEIRNAILSSVVPTPSLSGKTVSGGRLNVGGF